MLSQSQKYFVPEPSRWPIFGSFALFFMALGAAMWFNGVGAGPILVVIGLAILAYMLFGWFGTVAIESESGKFNKSVDASFRWGMSWFIFSEVMFFAAFFGALFYMRNLSIPWLASGDTSEQLWQGFTAVWPSQGPGLKEVFSPMKAMGIPAINTLILLTSGVTVTIAHWGLLKNNRGQLIKWLFATVVLGVLFLSLQAYEYGHAYAEGLTLKTGAYGSTFYMLTGFHGFHVTVGTIMLMVILGRSIKGHFTAEHHFGFEGVAWYWHFVDVVWLLLFILVYWL